jgi:hypothetical protein
LREIATIDESQGFQKNPRAILPARAKAKAE